jgi:RNA 2',3'-cyclic 3'-phosphodiesterase
VARNRAARPEARPFRLFVGVEIPEWAKDAVADAVEPWRERFPKARWAPRENWHVTVKFLGRTYPRLLAWVPEQVAAVASTTGPFPARVLGLGCLPDPAHARVVWAGLDDPREALAGLAERLDDALASGFKPEQRSFNAHLTVARSDPPLELPDDIAATTLRTAWFDIERLVVFRSHLRRPAPVYEPLAIVPLTG